MSIRALNINTLHRFTPGFAKRTDKSDVSASSVPRKTLLSRASDFILQKASAAVERHSKLRISKLQQKPTSPVFKPVKEESEQLGFEVSRDSDANLSVDEDERDLGRLGMSAHRCSMIKKYSIETYFLGPSPRKPWN